MNDKISTAIVFILISLLTQNTLAAKPGTRPVSSVSLRTLPLRGHTSYSSPSRSPLDTRVEALRGLMLLGLKRQPLLKLKKEIPAIAPGSDFKWGGSSSSNMASDAKRLPSDISSLRTAWELRLGSHQYSIPTIKGDRIYIGTNDAGYQREGVKRSGGGLLTCIEKDSGKTIWQLYSPRFLKGVVDPYHFNKWKCGICSGPVVDGNRIYIVGSRGEILCLDTEGQGNGNDGPFTAELSYMNAAPGTRLKPTDGDIVWLFDFKKTLKVIPHDVCGSTILINGDLLYACTSNGIGPHHKVVPHPLAPTLVVLNKKTGKLIAVDNEKIGTRLLHGNWSSPVAGRVNGKTLIFFGGGDGILYAFKPPAPQGMRDNIQFLKKVWSHDCNPPDYRILNGKKIPYSGWNHNSPGGPSEIIASPVFYKNRVYVAIGQSPLHGPGNGQLSCVDAATGKKVWASRLVNRSLSTVSILNGLLFISDYSGDLHCFNADTGERYWVHDMGSGAWSGSTFAADGKVYAGTKANIIWVLKADKEKKVLSKTRLKSMPITPTAIDGMLYIPTQKRLFAFPGPKK